MFDLPLPHAFQSDLSASKSSPGASGSTDGLAALAGRRILVVEDEALLAMDLELALRDVGVDVVGPAATIEEGMSLLRGVAVDAAILDVDLHGRPVFPLADALRAAEVPFAFHTGHATAEELTRRYGPVPVCAKPALSETLLARLAELLA